MSLCHFQIQSVLIRWHGGKVLSSCLTEMSSWVWIQSVWSLHAPSVSPWIHSRYCCFLPQLKDRHGPWNLQKESVLFLLIYVKPKSIEECHENDSNKAGSAVCDWVSKQWDQPKVWESTWALLECLLWSCQWDLPAGQNPGKSQCTSTFVEVALLTDRRANKWVRRNKDAND